MPTSARYAGRNARLFIGPTNGAVAVPMVFISNFTLDSSTDQFDVTAFGDGNKHKVTGLPNGDGTFKGFADIAGSDTYTASRDGLDRKSYFYPDFVNDPGSYYFFTAYYDYSGAWDVNAGASVSGKWSASSDITRVVA